ncbi:uncharacterized protein LOC129574371 [Sitodiplosis mosellana]|uniref:uncharacterized protein LOC129574371 n=1 Tax=Sitodiplosis mosellana TaxID=263140 RepID=UPI002444508B|nr:uncharacterized protein LOC129574371 [Sitodiplosis mosellana]XP_055312290.1 uncharacterized protein LOC129574371 [Sitodiplosis mosellana]XP_055312291.1 uncharacterized protein LOC129574371 [Sitodiplosis mosellana]XP_055312292.1 uncharacterized protein LOC129574371 [Sitodiplosis mosellana]XP_055312293.1 uncharacterized protein LOC129574371 [Sitodiplosis mosellana]XP_055312294.1 uncharacterized protein LOC129574371 [Sitodiplosis mosellana]XP_055312295.1 uncharacterized protein LOC129574371 [
MGKRYVDHDSQLDTPTNKKRKTESSHQPYVNDATATETTNQLTATAAAINDVTYSLTTDLVDGTVLTDLCAKKWRCGKPIGKGSFGEIFLASDDISKPVTSENAKFVVKIEPHKSGPLFVEIHCLIKSGKPTEEKPLPLGMPTYMASGGHFFGQTRYRFLILPRYDFDLHSIIRSRQVETKNILIIASQLIDILEHIHDCGYAHSDIKAENIMIGKCTYKKSKDNEQKQRSGNATSQQQQTVTTVANKQRADKRKPVRKLRMTLARNDSDTRQAKKTAESKSYAESSSSASSNKSDSDFGEDFDKLSDDDDDDEDEDVDDDEVDEDDEDDDDVISNSDLGSGVDSDTNSTNSTSDKEYTFSRRRNTKVEFSGSNPMRSCRKESNSTETYDAMVRSHYLRRSTKKVNYCENEDEEMGRNSDLDDDEWGRKNSYLKRIYSSAEKSTEKSQHRSEVKNGIDQLATLREDDEMQSEDRIHLIDFGLALKFVDSNGVHRPFVMDQRRAHDGTLEFTSRDAHMGAHSRRSDLECLAYNLIYWKEGYLPWKNEKIMSQPEQVHRMKEYFMTDIKQLYKKFYNVPIPAFIYEFLTHVANLAYHDRPNYKLCKDIFLREFLKLGYKQSEMVLNVADLRAAPQRKLDTDEIDAVHNVLGQKMMDVAKMMKMGMMMSFCETPTTPNQISPKNLRSKATQNTKKRRAKFSWTEILSTDPDQIARQRAEKEFEREPCDETPVRRYTGKPTYAIIQTENLKTKNKDRDHLDQPEDCIKGYNRAMMDVWRKRQSLLVKQLEYNNSITEEVKPTVVRGRRKPASTNTSTTNIASDKKLNGHSAEDVRIPNASDDALEKASPLQTAKQATKTTRRRKSGLRNVITPTKKISAYRETNGRKRKTIASTESTVATAINTTTTTTTTTAAAAAVAPTSSENSDASNPCCEISSKIAWWDLNTRGGSGTKNSSSSSSTIESSESLTLGVGGKGRRKYNSSCGMSSPASEEDSSHDSFDYRRPSTRCIRTRGAHTSAKPLVISDEDSRDTTDYSPVKNRHKRTKDSKSNRSRNKRTSAAAAARAVSGRKVTSELIRTFTRG